MESLEQIINWVFGGSVDASKIISILVGIYAVIKSITEWIAKKKLLKAEQQETTTQKKLQEAKEDIGVLKGCVSMLSDVVLTAYLSSNTIPEEVKKQLGHIGSKLNEAAGIDLQPVTSKLIEVITTIAPDSNLQEHKEELEAATEVVEETIDAGNEVVSEAIDKIKLGY